MLCILCLWGTGPVPLTSMILPLLISLSLLLLPLMLTPPSLLLPPPLLLLPLLLLLRVTRLPLVGPPTQGLPVPVPLSSWCPLMICRRGSPLKLKHWTNEDLWPTELQAGSRR